MCTGRAARSTGVSGGRVVAWPGPAAASPGGGRRCGRGGGQDPGRGGLLAAGCERTCSTVLLPSPRAGSGLGGGRHTGGDRVGRVGGAGGRTGTARCPSG